VSPAHQVLGRIEGQAREKVEARVHEEESIPDQTDGWIRGEPRDDGIERSGHDSDVRLVGNGLLHIG